MDEDIIKLLVEHWGLPEKRVRDFIDALMSGREPTLENFRISTASLIHSLILESSTTDDKS
jgi:hypothetical protein